MTESKKDFEDFIKSIEDNPNFDTKESDIQIDGLNIDDFTEELRDAEEEDDNIFNDHGGVLDPSKYNKYMAYYNIELFGKEEGSVVLLENANCVFTARSMEMARYISCHQIMEMCMMAQVAVYSFVLVKIECVETGEVYELKK